MIKQLLILSFCIAIAVPVSHAQCLGDESEDYLMDYPSDYHGKELVFLKGLGLEMNGFGDGIPYGRTIKYVFSKGNDYYFFINQKADNQSDFLFQMFNHNGIGIDTEMKETENGRAYHFTCLQTGVFYLKVYAEEDRPSCGALVLTFVKKPKR